MANGLQVVFCIHRTTRYSDHFRTGQVQVVEMVAAVASPRGGAQLSDAPGYPRTVGEGKAGRAKRIRIGSPRDLLTSFVSSHQKQFPTEYRLLMAAMGHPLPAEPCDCPRCGGRRQGWPVGYRRLGICYECWLHGQSDEFQRHLPHSSSIVRFG